MKMIKNQQWILKDKKTEEIVELIGDFVFEEKEKYEILFSPEHKPTKAQQKMIDEWKLEQQKQVKLNTLQKVYEDKENWIITIKDDEGNTLTHEIDWLKSNLAIRIFFFNDVSQPVEKHLTIQEVENIKASFILLSFERKVEKHKIENTIKNAKNKEELEQIKIVFNLQKEFTLEELKI